MERQTLMYGEQSSNTGFKVLSAAAVGCGVLGCLLLLADAAPATNLNAVGVATVTRAAPMVAFRGAPAQARVPQQPLGYAFCLCAQARCLPVVAQYLLA